MRVHLITLLLAFAVAQQDKKLPTPAELTGIFGPPPGLETTTDRTKAEILNIFGPPPNTGTTADPINKEIYDIFGPPTTQEPIDELVLPTEVFDYIFYTEDDEIIETTSNPIPTEPSKETAVDTRNKPTTSSLLEVTTESLQQKIDKIFGTNTPELVEVTTESLQQRIDKIFGTKPPELVEVTTESLQQKIDKIFGTKPPELVEVTTESLQQKIDNIFGTKPPELVEMTTKSLHQNIDNIFGTKPSTLMELTTESLQQKINKIFSTNPPKLVELTTESLQQKMNKTSGTKKQELVEVTTESLQQRIDKIFGTKPTKLVEVTTESLQQKLDNIFGRRPSTLVEVTTESLQQKIDKIFGTKPTESVKVTTESLQQRIDKLFGTKTPEITVKPTEMPATFVAEDGQTCKCVPYYLCDKDHNGVDINNASVTGYGELDIRFGDECQETVELCCKEPKDPSTVPPPVTDPTKLKRCGYRNPIGLDFTLTGGTGKEALFGEFPWVVALMNATNGSLVGVGAIIHPQVIITGAHIAYKFAPGTIRVKAGEWDTQTEQERLKHQIRDVQEIYTHFDFHPKSLRNDLALLKLSQPLQLDVHINMICLPSQDESFDTSVGCISNGWGKNVFGVKGIYAVILKKVEVPMVPYNRCSNQLQNTRLGHRFILHPSFVCAGGEEGQDTCTGDGGGPLACPIGDDRYKLAGMVAWGVGCGKKDVPAVYAGVANFRDLIDAKMIEWGYGTSTYSIE